MKCKPLQSVVCIIYCITLQQLRSTAAVPSICLPQDRPAIAPCCKMYTNGKHCMKGPGPEHFIMALAEFYGSDQASELWISKLVSWIHRQVLAYKLLLNLHPRRS